MHTKRTGVLLSSAACLLGTALPAMAATPQFSILVQQTTIKNTSNQVVQIVATPVSGPTAIYGVDIYVQIDNGGVNNGYATNPTAPTVTGIDLTTGIFNASNSSFSAPEFEPNDLIVFAGATVDATAPVVSGSAVLGSLTLNASGLAPGSTFDVYFEQVGNGPNGGSDFGLSDSDYGLSNSTAAAFAGPTYPGTPDVISITAVPEPTTALFSGLGCLALLRRRRR